MTKVRLSCRPEDGTYSVTCHGHATGSSEMCAAVSTLTQTLAGWLHNVDGVTLLAEEIEPGHVEIEFAGGEAAQAAFELMAIGFLQLQATDPERISVVFRQKSTR